MTEPTPPVAERRPESTERHGETVVDDYGWLRDDARRASDVIAYLEAENAYTDAMLAHTEELRTELFEEIKSRIKQTDESAPVPKDGWFYYHRTVEGEQYAIHGRRRGSLDADEQIVLDENALAEGHGYFALGGLAVTPDHRIVAYSTDVDGSEVFTLRFRDLATGEDLDDVVEGVSYALAWFNDSATILYTRMDAAKRPYQVWRHRLGTDPADDVLVHQEDDERFWLGCGRTRSRRFVVIEAGSKVTSEAHVLEADDPASRPRLVAAREQGVEYDVAHRGDHFYLVTNADGAEDFKLVTAPVEHPGREHWRDLVGHRPGVRLEGVDCFAGHVVLYERAEALTRIRVLVPETGDDHVIDQAEDVYVAGPGPNAEYDTTTLRYGYTSMVTPRSTYDYDVRTRERTLVKQQEVLGDVDLDAYETTREWATAPDGTRVPISIVHRRGIERDGSNPTVLYAYGSYEISIDPGFSSLRLSLLDRGFVFALAHPRGGGELGRRWYEDGKYLAKRNTFTDVIACAEHLVAEGWTRPGRLGLRGGSAGGLMVGAVVNERPELFGAAVAEVPFVDVVSTMWDETLPLTVVEYEEWGDPKDPTYFDYIRSYSPYDNVRAQDYPAMLVTGGLNDPRVGYWEPAKWVAKLRTLKTDANPLLLKMEMGAGHAGPSGRYDAWRDEALVLAFLLDRLAATVGA
ncbi:MAG: S9 family peptidase [Actinobacteria bacterium]|nr:S9 family peptidase [Actinomycetota bacterium]